MRSKTKTATCPSGFSLTGCSCFSSNDNCLGTSFEDDRTCKVHTRCMHPAPCRLNVATRNQECEEASHANCGHIHRHPVPQPLCSAFASMCGSR